MDKAPAILPYHLFEPGGIDHPTLAALHPIWVMDLSQPMYVSSDVSRLQQRYDAELYRVGCTVYHTRCLKAHFGISKFASKTLFATWKHFLLAGMKGETALARTGGAYASRSPQIAPGRVEDIEDLAVVRHAEHIVRVPDTCYPSSWRPIVPPVRDLPRPQG